MDKRLQSIQRYVRITAIRDKRYVEFDFSIDDPTLYVELCLPFESFQQFCKQNQVIHLNREQAAQVDFDRLKWQYGKQRQEAVKQKAE